MSLPSYSQPSAQFKAYRSLAAPLEHQEIIKNSRFIVVAQKVTTVDAALEVLEHCRQQYPDASHHCWAYRLDGVYRFSDDGEPGGTAGRPMLELLEKRQLDRIMAVIIRYFGGVKLGAGGLVRAYAGSLAKALDTADIEEVKPRTTLRIHVPYSFSDVIFRFLDEASAMRIEKAAPDYDGAGVLLSFSLLADCVDNCLEQLTELSQGQVVLQARAELALD